MSTNYPPYRAERLLYSLDTKPEEWEIRELRRTVVNRLYACPNCEAILWDRAGDGYYMTSYVVLHDDRDELYARLEHPGVSAGRPVGDAWVGYPLDDCELELFRG